MVDKQKRTLDIGLQEHLLQARTFDHTVFSEPRHFTRHMSSVVRYPKLINDVGRTVDVRRDGENRFVFEIRQKRYLGRGNYAISARAKGLITYNENMHQTQITGFVQLGGQYVILINVMTAFCILSLGLLAVTILFLPLALLTFSVIGLHWIYLFSDRRELQEQLIHLVNLTNRELRLSDMDRHKNTEEAEQLVKVSLHQEISDYS